MLNVNPRRTTLPSPMPRERAETCRTCAMPSSQYLYAVGDSWPEPRDRDEVSQIAHQMACDILVDRALPCTCPMVLEMQHKWASYEKWRCLGLTPTPAGRKNRKAEILNAEFHQTPRSELDDMDEPLLEEDVQWSTLGDSDRMNGLGSGSGRRY